MSADLNKVFADAFVEALQPILGKIELLFASAEIARDRIDALELLLDSDVGPLDQPTVCGVTPEAEFGQQWVPCDLPFDHDGPHNVGLVP